MTPPLLTQAERKELVDRPAVFINATVALAVNKLTELVEKVKA